jgi:hypothetical protein
MRQSLPAWNAIKPDTPLRLGVPASLAIPGGGMTAFRLKRESARGNLIIECITAAVFGKLGQS